MTISLSFISIIALKRAIKEHYKGGLEGFEEEYPTHVHDEHLVGLNFMSQGEADEIMSSLLLNGLLPGRDVGMSDRTYGSLMDNPNIHINVTFTDDLGFDQYNEAEYTEAPKSSKFNNPSPQKGSSLNISPSMFARAAKTPEGIDGYIKYQKSRLRNK